jgi:hypothetical protein
MSKKRSFTFVLDCVIIFNRMRTKARQKKKDLCRDPGSNQGPSDLQSDALPTELSRRITTDRVLVLIWITIEIIWCRLTWYVRVDKWETRILFDTVNCVLFIWMKHKTSDEQSYVVLYHFKGWESHRVVYLVIIRRTVRSYSELIEIRIRCLLICNRIWTYLIKHARVLLDAIESKSCCRLLSINGKQHERLKKYSQYASILFSKSRSICVCVCVCICVRVSS